MADLTDSHTEMVDLADSPSEMVDLTDSLMSSISQFSRIRAAYIEREGTGAMAKTLMTMEEAARARHTVRKFLDKALPADAVEALAARVDADNASHGTAIELRVDDTAAFDSLIRRILAKGARNYFVLAGVDAPDLAERLGHAGSDLCLFAQTLGLNTWWVGGTYSFKRVEKMYPGLRVFGVIVVGYGATQGKPHRSKTAVDVSSYEGEAPEWFDRGVEFALLAPTAINRQAFKLLGRGAEVEATYAGGAFSGIDLGIVKHHFELGAGAENFTWA